MENEKITNKEDAEGKLFQEFLLQDLEVLRHGREGLIARLEEVRSKILIKKQELEKSPDDPVLPLELKQKEMVEEDLKTNLSAINSAIAEKEK